MNRKTVFGVLLLAMLMLVAGVACAREHPLVGKWEGDFELEFFSDGTGYVDRDEPITWTAERGVLRITSGDGGGWTDVLNYEVSGSSLILTWQEGSEQLRFRRLR